MSGDVHDRISRLERCLVRPAPSDQERFLGAIECLHDALRHLSPIAVSEDHARALDDLTGEIYSVIARAEKLAALEAMREAAEEAEEAEEAVQ